MKKYIVAFVAAGLILSGKSASAQVVDGINYQAVVIDQDGKEIAGLDINGNVIPDKTFDLRFTILEKNPFDVIVYQEVHSTNSDNNGLFSVIIGHGTVTSAGTYSSILTIPWGLTQHYLRVEIDLERDGNYKLMGEEQMQAVPYALYSLNGLPPGTNGQTVRHDSTQWVANSLLFNNGTNVGIGTTSPASLFSVGTGSPFQVGTSGKIDTATGILSSGKIQFWILAPAAGVVHNSAQGVLSSGLVDLISEVTGILPIANGGTNTSIIGSAGSMIYSNGTQYASSTSGATGQVLISGGVGSPTWADPAGLAVRWNSIIAPNGNLFMAHGANTTGFSFDGVTSDTAFGLSSTSLTSGTIFDISSTSTAGAGGGSSKLLNLSRSGGNSFSNHTAYGIFSSVTASGTASANVAGYFSAANATDNYAGIFENGNVGIGTTAPLGLFSVGTGSPFQVNTAGKIDTATGITSSGTIKFYSLTPAGVVHNNAAGVLSSGLVNLNSEVSGILPLANGGTNASLTATNGGIVWSNASQFQISPAGTAGYVLTSSGAGVPTWTDPAGLGVRWNSIIAPNGNLTLPHGIYTTAFSFDGVTTGTAFTMSSNSLTNGNLFSLSSTNANSTGNVFLASSNSVGPVSGIARFNFTGAHTGNGLQIDDVTTSGTAVVVNANSVTNGTGLAVNANALSTGTGFSVMSTATGLNSGSLFLARSACTNNATGIARFDFTGAHTGIGLRVDDVTTTGTAMAVNANVATSGTGLKVNVDDLTSGTGLFVEGAGTGLTGNLFLARSASTSTAANGLARFDFTGAHTGSGLQIDDATVTGNAVIVNANALTTTGTGLRVNANALSTGTGLSVMSTATGLTGNLFLARSASNSNATTGLARFDFTGTHTGSGVQIDDATVSGTALAVNVSALDGGTGLAVTSSNSAATGNAFLVTSNSVNEATNGGIARFNFTGPHTGSGVQIDDATASGTALAVNASALTTGTGLAVTSSNAGATGNAFLASSNSTGDAANGIARFNFTGAHIGYGVRIDDATVTGNAVTVNANALTTIGTAFAVNANALTSGTGFSLLSTGTGGTGNLFLAGSASASNANTGIARFLFTGAHIGSGIQVDDATASGVAVAVNANALSNGTGVSISSTSTAGIGGGSSRMLNIARSGANVLANHTAYGVYSSVTNNGTTSTNVAGYFSAAGVGATNNYAGIFENGNVGIGTTTPVNKLDVEGAAVIGSTYSGTTAGPANGLLVEGAAGIGTTTPANKLDVEGAAVIGATYSGTNVAPANGLLVEGSVGIGTPTPNSTLQVLGSMAVKYDAIIANTTLDASHYFIAASGNITGITISLPPAGPITGRMYIIEKVDIGAGSVTVDGNGAELINNSLTVTLPNQYKGISIISNGSGWLIFSNNIGL